MTRVSIADILREIAAFISMSLFVAAVIAIAGGLAG